MDNRFKKEFSLYNSGAEFVVGVDEVGRGPLAGPVVAAVVVFKKDFAQDFDGLETEKNSWWHQITDSKKLSEKKRFSITEEIKNNSLYSIGIASVEEIEQLNILQASLLAMSRAVEGVVSSVQTNGGENNFVLLVDGRNVIPKLNYKQEAIVKGDSLVHSIAAASIVAKVYRDNLMQELSQEFPEYGLAQHKGYGTKLHIEAIKKFGLSPIHRASFCGNIV